ncbi:hypothetical protein EPN15_01820 [Patescibacteria group bacterium]|nr:MAG: hypothetical protein EPN15_01820 [Patescibacteria group bacterium]
MKKIGIIGFGNIGKNIYEKVKEKGWKVEFVINSKGVFPEKFSGIPEKESLDSFFRHGRYVDLVFLAIPTLDDGKIAKNYIDLFIKNGIPVVTCEKGALSNYFIKLKPHLSRVGFSATVGGGSGMIQFLQQRFSSGTREVHTVLNGTLNYIWDDLKMGNPLGHIVEEITKLGYTEPGKSDPYDIILREVGSDTTKKASILFNLCFNSKRNLQAKDIVVTISPETIIQAINEAMMRRFVVSFEKQEYFRQESDSISAFKCLIDGWIITGGFKRTDRNPLIARLCNSTTWVNNAILTVEGDSGADGVYICGGPGAGASPTSAAMIRDAERLLLK